MTLSPSTPFVVFGDDWGRHVSTMQHVFQQIIPEYPVIWINGVGHRVPRLDRRDLRRLWEKGRGLMLGARPSARDTGRRTGPQPLEVVQPAVLPWHHWRGVHAWNTRSLLRAVEATLRRHGLAAPPVLVTGSPPTVGVVGRLGERISVYYCMDDFLSMPEHTSPEMLAPLEARLLQKVDVLVATADSLTQSKRPASGRAFHLPQGVDYDHFSAPREVPADLQALPRPIIGFSGGLKERCDLELLNRVAERYPQGSVVLVGPTFVSTAPLQRPNIHVLGARPFHDLPAYVQAFDVGIIPYAITAETRAVDPLKLLEYAAAGLAIVSTAIPEARKYDPVVAVGTDHGAFLDCIDRWLAADRNTVRRDAQALARKHTWQSRADRFLNIVNGVLEDAQAA